MSTTWRRIFAISSSLCVHLLQDNVFVSASSCEYDSAGAEEETGWAPGTKCKDQSEYCAGNTEQGSCEMYKPCCKWTGVMAPPAPVIATPDAEPQCEYNPSMATNVDRAGSRCSEQQAYCSAQKGAYYCSMYTPCCKWTGSPDEDGAGIGSAAQTQGARMSELFATWDEVKKASGVRGVSWSDLQKRCAPGAGPGQSQGGYINNDKDIRKVLEEDWTAVAAMGATHLELVAHLDKIWDSAKPCEKEFSEQAELSYDASLLMGNTLTTTGPQKLHLSCIRTRGLQQDLLDPNDWTSGWNVQWTVANGNNKVQVGGRNSSSGLLRYTKMFGFYEAGDANEFRVDPTQLVSVLTGRRVLSEAGASREITGSAKGSKILGPFIAIVLLSTLAFMVVCYCFKGKYRYSKKELNEDYSSDAE